MKNIFVVTIAIVCTAVVSSAQNSASVDSTLRTIESLYNNARYVDAELESRRLLEESSISDSAKVQIEKWIAFSLIAQGKPTSARERFVHLLFLNPDFDLDPVLTSPKILSVFNDAKAKFLSLKRLQSDTITVVSKNAHRAITYRTLIFPGWEQLYHGRMTSGSLFLGAGIATLGAGLTYEVLRADAREQYLNATQPSDIASKYDAYNFYRKAEMYSFIGFALVYLASEIDVLTYSDASPIVLYPSSNQFSHGLLTLSIRF
ncbi:MAG: hypothetical protein AB1600_08265 [Bacteroidota bacterium]